jgi:electron transfer flavoprotein beta subunit
VSQLAGHHLKIVVPVRLSAGLPKDLRLAPDARSVLLDAPEWDLAEGDMFPLEAALELREAAGEGEVVVVTISNAEAREGLLTALALGADRAVQIVLDGLGDLDAIATARVLSTVVQRESPDLVLCGAESAGESSGADGVALAAFLGLPRVAVVRKIEFDGDRGTATVERALEDGLVELLKVSTPALLTVQPDACKPRYATLRGIRHAFSKPMEVLTLEEVGLDTGSVGSASGARLVSLALPPKYEGAEMIEGGPEEIAERIAAIIKIKVG